MGKSRPHPPPGKVARKVKKEKEEKGKENSRKYVKIQENFIKLVHFTLLFFKKNLSTRNLKKILFLLKSIQNFMRIVKS